MLTPIVSEILLITLLILILWISYRLLKLPSERNGSTRLEAKLEETYQTNYAR